MTDLIRDSKELKERIKPFFKEEFVTVDTEFLREKTYYPQLCLIQIGGKNDAFAIDPMDEKMDMKPFYKLMDDKKVCKVFHACSQDLEIVLNEHGKLPRNVFDTQIAAKMLGFGEAIGYGNLVEELTGTRLDKSSRHTDWTARPLSEKQLSYAMSDVTHLYDIYPKMVDLLNEKGRYKWVAEEMEPYLETSMYEVNPKEAWKKIKLRSHKKAYLSAVASLCRWREERAQKMDKPRNWVIKNDAILEIAALDPKKPEDLEGLRFFDSKKNKELTSEIMAACRRSKRSLPPKVERKKSLPKGSGPLMDLLRVLLKSQCDHHQIAPSVVAKVSELEDIARDDNPNIPAMKGWRYDVFGKYAMQLKRGELAMTAHGSKIVLIEPEYTEGSK